jgi:uncharacterized protein YdeI (YjbR/CyaY-like superfamily)
MLIATSRAQWRAWLQKRAQSAVEVWLVFFKRHTGRPTVSYDDAVEEALCFGWIDSIIRRIDHDRYAQKFTPRKPRSAWSQSNIHRMTELIAARKVTAAGLEAFAGHERRIAPAQPRVMPADLKRRFQKATRAWKHFGQCPPGYRRMAIGWVASAKRPETRIKRLDQLIETSARGERLSFI